MGDLVVFVGGPRSGDAAEVELSPVVRVNIDDRRSYRPDDPPTYVQLSAGRAMVVRYRLDITDDAPAQRRA